MATMPSFPPKPEYTKELVKMMKKREKHKEKNETNTIR